MKESITATPKPKVLHLSLDSSKKHIPESLQKQVEDKRYDVSKGVLLAQKFDDTVDLSGWWLSEKFDGVRAIWDGYDLFSRTAKKINASEDFLSALPKGISLDGELFIGRGNFSQTTSITSKKIPIKEEWKIIRFKAFDLPNSNEFFEERMLQLKQLGNHIIQPVDHILIENNEHLLKIQDEITKKGAEGLMIRKPNSKYEPKRSKTLLKLKNFSDEDAIVTGRELGKGRLSNGLGKLVVKWVKNPSVSFKVGTGFDDKTRFGDYENQFRDGTIVIVKFFELDSKTGRPRFPVFLGKRHEQ